MPQHLPAVSLVAVPGRRRRTIEIAQEIERRGFAGLYSPSMFGNMSLCEAQQYVTALPARRSSSRILYEGGLWPTDGGESVDAAVIRVPKRLTELSLYVARLPGRNDATSLDALAGPMHFIRPPARGGLSPIWGWLLSRLRVHRASRPRGA